MSILPAADCGERQYVAAPRAWQQTSTTRTSAPSIPTRLFRGVENHTAPLQINAGFLAAKSRTLRRRWPATYSHRCRAAVELDADRRSRHRHRDEVRRLTFRILITSGSNATGCLTMTTKSMTNVWARRMEFCSLDVAYQNNCSAKFLSEKEDFTLDRLLIILWFQVRILVGPPIAYPIASYKGWNSFKHKEFRPFLCPLMSYAICSNLKSAGGSFGGKLPHPSPTYRHAVDRYCYP